MKYYFRCIDSENCYTKQHFIDYMAENKLTEILVWPAEAVRGERVFWCAEYQEVGDTGEACGKTCRAYKPCNGKNGRCVHHTPCRAPADNPVKLRL